MFRKKKSKKPEARNRPQAVQDGKAKTVFSYYSSSSARSAGSESTGGEGSVKLRRGAKLRRVFVGTLAIASIAAALYSLLVSNEPQIELVQDDIGKALLKDPEVYEKAAARLIGDSLFNRNKLTFDADSISDQLKNQFTEVSEATVVLPLIGHDPVVHIQSFKPKLVLVDGNTALILDGQGRVQTDSSGIAGLDKLDLPVVRDESALAVERGQLALSKEHVDFISEVAHQLKAKDIKIANMTLPPGGSELVVQVEDTPYSVRFSLYGDAKEQAGRYLAAKDYFKANGEPSEYVDARVDNHIYYR